MTHVNDKQRAQGEVSFSKNGQELGVAFNVPAESRKEQFFPAVAFKNAQVSRSVVLHLVNVKTRATVGV